MPKVSIIIPIYNVEKYIKECLDSLVNQTLEDIEIVCVNDGSPDNSMEIVNVYAKNDKRFVVINQENQGTGAARNKGIDAATGEYIMFLDPDDWYELDACEKAYNHIKKNNTDFAFFGMKYFYEETSTTKVDTWRLKELLLVPDMNNINLRELNSIYVKTGECVYKIYNRHFLLDNNIRFTHTKMGEDYPFSFKAIILADRVSVLNKPLYNYRKHQSSSTETGAKNWKEILYNRNLVLDEILKSEYKNEFLHAFIPMNVNGLLLWYERYQKKDSSISSKFYSEIRKHFIRMNTVYDCSQLKNCMKYKQFKKIVKNSYYKRKLKELPGKIIKNIFEVTNINDGGICHKSITILGIKIKIKKETKIDKIKRNYENLLDKFKEQKKDKYRVLFLVNEIEKWKTQSLYDLLKEDNRFEPIIAITALKLKKEYKNEGINKLEACKKYFDEKNIQYEIVYDVKKNKPIPLQKYNPDLVFYQQPWCLFKQHMPNVVSKFALTYYIPYFVPNYGELSLDVGRPLHKQIFKYYVLNEKWQELYENYLPEDRRAGYFAAVGHTFLDNLRVDGSQKYEDKYVIYAPHYSIPDEHNKNLTNYSTFNINGLEILEYAKSHPEISWAFKPHPRLKIALANLGWSKDEIEQYYNDWAKIGKCCFDSEYADLFLNSKAMITDCGSFLVEYFVTQKPVIHLVSDRTSIIPQEASKIIFDTYYTVCNIEDLYCTLDKILIDNDDDKKDERLAVLKELKLLDNYAAKNIMKDLENTLLN